MVSKSLVERSDIIRNKYLLPLYRNREKKSNIQAKYTPEEGQGGYQSKSYDKNNKNGNNNHKIMK